MMKTIIIDTNAFLAISTFNLDIFEAVDHVCDFPYCLAIVEGTIAELEKIKTDKMQKGKDKLAAKLGLQILKQKIANKEITVMKDDSTVSVDDNLVFESEQGALVLTQDKGLKDRLTPPYLTIRQKKKIVFVE
jgi:rRNA-processing protein FCF1